MTQLTYQGPDIFSDLPNRTPELLVVVDAEEEFDWTKPFNRNNREVASITENNRAHEIYDRLGVSPTYCVDQCVAENPVAVEYLNSLVKEGRCSIGTQLHPWVTPPYDEDVNDFNSYHGNLPESLERAKINTVTDTIEQAFGVRPRIFKAGRYGIGPNTIGLLIEAGYNVDCSFVPHTSFHSDGGPSFIGLQDQPFWLDDEKTILEIPLTKGFSGCLAGVFPVSMARVFDSDLALRLRAPGILSRLGLVDRATLSPEGVITVEQIRLVRSMVQRGKRVFTLTYHSSSLSPGNTPYVRSEDDLREFLIRIEDFLTFFRDEIGGVFTTMEKVRDEAFEEAGRNQIP
ncbi:MAG: glycosyltransferase [Rhodospirillaceae bacterium]|nr:glycosyltransferase [Rhodospirillaceae bacterium]MBT5667509.1 glycosyltransferase [Rhodospirillaceae bacterium]MBT5810407.1 glycosyltransferase [Rhodospirillaceae bacterium]